MNALNLSQFVNVLISTIAWNDFIMQRLLLLVFLLLYYYCRHLLWMVGFSIRRPEKDK